MKKFFQDAESGLINSIDFAFSSWLPYSYIKPNISKVTKGWNVSLNSKHKQVIQIIL